MRIFFPLRPLRLFEIVTAGAVLGSALAAPALAADLFDYPTYDEFGEPVYNDMMSVSAGVGLVNISANELVYNGASTLSHLSWNSVAIPTVSARIDARLDEGWTFEASGEAGLGGYNEMVDTDWIAPFATGNGPDDWSDRSIHPDTVVDHYISARIAMGYDIVDAGPVVLNLKGGFSYTDVQWTARGGSFVYSQAALRDTIGTIADGVAGVSYQQSFPVAFAGAELRGSMGAFSFTAGAEGGFTFYASATDQHYLRSLRFVDELEMAPMVAANARIDYNYSDFGSIYLSAAVQKMFTARGNETITNTGTGATAYFADSIGADFASLSFSAGLMAIIE